MELKAGINTETDTDVWVCVLDWGPEDSEAANGNGHLWEESWDDDDTSEDFSKQLKYVAF